MTLAVPSTCSLELFPDRLYMSGNVLGTHIKQDMEIEAQLEMQRDRRALQAQQQAADAAAAAAVSPRRTPVSNLHLRQYSQMENSNSHRALLESCLMMSQK